MASLFSSNAPPETGRNNVFPIISDIFIFIFFGIIKRPIDAIKISLIVSTKLLSAKCVRSAFPKQKTTTTPTLPNLFNIPAIIP